MGIVEESLLRVREKLLDLSPRNRLLSFRETAQSLRIVDELPRQVFQQLVDEQGRMAFEPYPEDDDEEERAEDDDNESLFLKVADKPLGSSKRQKSSTIATELPRSADEDSDKHQDLLLQTNLGPLKLETRCRRIIQSSRVAIEEMGINVLYLAMGFLEWYQTEEPERKRLAPLILIPVAFERGKMNRSNKCYQYFITHTGEDLETNLCLREKLARDFDLVLPEFSQEGDIDVEEYFASVSEMAVRKKNWRVAREMLLGMFSFAKQRMYKDLGSDSWPDDKKISEHEKLKDLLEGRKLQSASLGVCETYDEEQLEKAKIPLVLDADSSQHTALADILSGRDQVIIGPPGTGKSQTITNLIAAAMGEGKSVLFVSEKLAALEVVRRRLEQVGLGIFCLELHSWKTQKRRLLDDLERRLKFRPESPKAIREAIKAYRAAKEPLNEYVQLINSIATQTDETIQEVLWAAERWKTEKAAEGPTFRIPMAVKLSRNDITVKENVLRDITTQLESAPLSPKNVWRGYRPLKLLAGDESQLQLLLQDAAEELEQLQSTVSSFLTETQLPLEVSLDRILKFDGSLLDILRAIPLPFDEEFGRTAAKSDVTPALESLERQIEQYRATLRNAGTVLREDLPTEDYPTLLDHSERLRVSNFAVLPLAKLRTIHESCIEAKSALSELSLVSGQLEQVGFERVESISQLSRFLIAANHIIKSPQELDSVVCKGHVQLDAQQSFEQSYSEFRKFEIEFAKHSPVIDFARCPSSDDLVRLATVIRDKQGGLFSFLSGELRRARAEVKTFVKIAALTKTPTLPDRLLEIAELNRRLEAATGNLLVCTKLGPSFKGRQTNWQLLIAGIAWVHELRTLVGSALTERVVANFPTAKSSLIQSVAGIERVLDRVKKALQGCSSNRVIGDVTTFVEKYSISEQAEFFDKHACLLGESLPVLESVVTHQSHDPTSIKKAVVCLQNASALFQELLSNAELAKLFGPYFKGMDTDTAHVRHLKDWIKKVQNANTSSKVKHWLFEKDILSRTAMFTAFLERMAAGATTTRALLMTLDEYGELQVVDFFGNDAERVKLSAAAERLKECSTATTGLMQWADYCRLAAKACELGLSEMVLALERGQVRPENLREVFVRSLYDSMSRHVIKAHPELTHFTRATHERIRQQYAELDLKLMKEIQKQIAYTVSRREIPQGVSHGYVSEYTEKHLIDNELRKKKKHIPIRQLVTRSARALQAMKPCFMMSPLSVALYLEPAGIEFDLVVMDEASQLRPEDALGAVARGRQLVVVGDPKQLPPTTFFEKVNEGEEDEEETETATDFAESILDVCLKTYQPARQLLWHYRSQHESLIAFSNRQFYESDLIVFPSPQGARSGLGIVSHYIEGAKYSKGRNPLEAEAVAQAVVQHVLRYPALSLGVGTFNHKQRDLILDALDRLLKENSAAQRVVDEMHNGNEPFFVKNLENIQGDERDVIFISTTFGPDAEVGSVHQRFGLSDATGWRRLNVLFTRAKKRIEVFTSLRPSDIKITAGASRGPVAFKAYLEYAESGRFTEHGQATGRAPDSDFEISVARVVESFGFKVTPQVGVAGFFIDIGVVHPHCPGEFLLGIECDGATYHSARSARDRDRLRQEILEKLNWKLHRIWSTEWFKNRDTEIKRLNERLNSLALGPGLNGDSVAKSV